MEPQPPRIGLALSGGGFRATLFHLGVIKLLRDTGRLPNLKRIGAVSGGSILAAHLVLNWERYTGTDDQFNEAARELIDFTRYDVRGRVVRKWLLSWLLLVPRLFLRKHWTFTNLLQNCYARLFRDATLKNLRGTPTAPRPQVYFYCTSLSTGECCSFGRSGFMWHDDNGAEHRITAASTPVAFAVAASSAFPPLFPPIAVNADVLACDLREFPNPHFLTDGGVYDNLGIDRMFWYQAKTKDIDEFIVSDAEGNFDWDFKNDFALITTRNIRASGVLMKRVSSLLYNLSSAVQVPVTRVHISSEVLSPDPAVLDTSLQRSVRNIRTDLDRFSEDEIRLIIQHGYTVARASMIKNQIIPAETPFFSWPLVENTKQKSRILTAASMRAARLRRYGLWSPTDPSSWLALAVVLVYLGIATIPLMQVRKSGVETGTQDTATIVAASNEPASEAKAAIENKISDTTAGLLPRVYIHISSESQRPVAQQIRKSLQDLGYVAPGIENVGPRSPNASEIRFFREEDREIAVEVQSKIMDNAKVVKAAMPPNSKARPKHLEIWFNKQ